MSGDGDFGESEWFGQLHRYAPCEPAELALAGPDLWLSPFAFGFHGDLLIITHIQATRH